MAATAQPATITLNIDIKPFAVTVNGSAASVVLQTTGQTAATSGQPAAPAPGQTAPAAGGNGQNKKPFPQEKLEESQKNYDALLNGYNLSLGQRVQIGFGDGVKDFVESWKSGVLSVINKQATIGSAFDKLIVGMRMKLRDFFVNWVSEQVAVGAMDLLGIKTKPTDPAQTAAQAGGNASATPAANAGAAGGSSTNAAVGSIGTAGSASTSDPLMPYLRPDSLLGTIWSKISPLFKPDGLLGGLMSGISGLISSLFKPDGLLGGILSGISSFISMIFHTGGIVGETARPGRMVSAGLFAGAPRFHGGGLVAGEVPIIARKGEAVFTPEQMTNADRLIQVAQDGGRAVTQSVTVNVAGGSTGDREQDKALAERIGASVREQLRAMMGNELRQQMRPGGMLNNMSYGG